MKKQLFSRLANDHQILFCGMCSCLLSATTSILLGWDVKSSLDSMTIRLGSIVTTDMPIYVYLQHNSIWSDEISSHGQYTWKVLGFFFSSLISLHSLETGFSFWGGNCSQRRILQLFLTIAFYGEKKINPNQKPSICPWN